MITPDDVRKEVQYKGEFLEVTEGQQIPTVGLRKRTNMFRKVPDGVRV